MRPTRLALIVLALIVVFGGPTILTFYTDWLWFGEVGYQQVFSTSLRAQGTLFVIAFGVAVAWMLVNLRVAAAAVGDVRPVFTTREGMEVLLPGRRQMQTIAPVVALVAGVLVGLFASAQWQTWLGWRNEVPFGQADPILGRDVSFYLFTLPMLQLTRAVGMAIVVLSALACGAVYLVSGSLTTGFPARLLPNPSARRHLTLLGAAFLLLLAFGAWLGRFEHLVTSSGLIFGASYADVYGRIPASLALTVAALVGAGLAAWQAFSERLWPVFAAVALYVATLMGGEAYGTLLQRFAVAPNEQVREEPFIKNNIDATRRAFGLDRVVEQELSGDALLTRGDIVRNAATLENVRLWDHQPLLDTFGQLQEIRTYYDFASVDNDRYILNGRPRQVMLSARELNSSSLPNRTWVNERLTFTHGYGLTLGPVNQVTNEGLPVLFVRNLPP